MYANRGMNKESGAVDKAPLDNEGYLSSPSLSLIRLLDELEVVTSDRLEPNFMTASLAYSSVGSHVNIITHEI